MCPPLINRGAGLTCLLLLTAGGALHHLDNRPARWRDEFTRLLKMQAAWRIGTPPTHTHTPRPSAFTRPPPVVCSQSLRFADMSKRLKEYLSPSLYPSLSLLFISLPFAGCSKSFQQWKCTAWVLAPCNALFHHHPPHPCGLESSTGIDIRLFSK